MTDWINTNIKSVEGVHPTDQEMHGDSSSTTKGLEVYELWGKIPERLITGDEKDTDEGPFPGFKLFPGIGYRKVNEDVKTVKRGGLMGY